MILNYVTYISCAKFLKRDFFFSLDKIGKHHFIISRLPRHLVAGTKAVKQCVLEHSNQEEMDEIYIPKLTL